MVHLILLNLKNINTFDEVDATELALNDIAKCTLSL